MKNEKSLCCKAPMLDGRQCEVCGADGRADQERRRMIENLFRYSFKERRELYNTLLEERVKMKAESKTAWSETERVAKYKEIAKINRQLWMIAEFSKLEKNTTYGKVMELGDKVDQLITDIKEAFKDEPIVKFIKKLLRF